METVKRVCELDPSDMPIFERVFGQGLDTLTDAELILRVPDSQPIPHVDGSGVPAWFDVLEGFDDNDLAEFDSALQLPVRVAGFVD